jgi:hypothetical protein
MFLAHRLKIICHAYNKDRNKVTSNNLQVCLSIDVV